jgi:hypothetical protein
MRLDPTIAHDKDNWTVEEVAKLTDAVTEHCNQWFAVAALVPGRSKTQSRQRWIDSEKAQSSLKR